MNERPGLCHCPYKRIAIDWNALLVAVNNQWTARKDWQYKMEKEFNLSEKGIYTFGRTDTHAFGGIAYKTDDIKEFIKLLKFHGEIHLGKDTITIKYSKFKELAGDKLNGI